MTIKVQAHVMDPDDRAVTNRDISTPTSELEELRRQISEAVRLQIVQFVNSLPDPQDQPAHLVTIR